MKIHNQDYVNHVILNSLRLDMRLKRYYTTKFAILCKFRGERNACDLFKQLRELVMSYISDPSRKANITSYYRSYPFRKNGWMRKLFDYAETQPHQVLNLLKLYTSFDKPLISVEESAKQQHAYLQSRSGNIKVYVPAVIVNWFAALNDAYFLYYVRYLPNEREYIRSAHAKGTWKYSDPVYKKYKNTFNWRSYDSHFRSFKGYWTYWYPWVCRLGRLRAIAQSENAFDDIIEPTASLYKDFESSSGSSNSFDDDLNEFKSWMSCDHEPDPEDPFSGLHYVQKAVYSRVVDHLPDDFPVTDICPDKSILGCGGKIHHIPKKGTVKRRPIAVPNRFFQAGLYPLMKFLQVWQDDLERDCTFDQSKPIVHISSLLKQDKYVGSVDLSQATDNLPYSWGHYLLQQVIDFKAETPISESAVIFDYLASDFWDNAGYKSKWTVGQPLGTLPSFGLLAITHNILCEALSYSVGNLRSPYYVLGDDVVLFDKKVRQKYIHLMDSHGIPLSLHKSYENRMVEFAGRVFVKNTIPWYTSDHALITWPSLFDYQRSTGTFISWQNLPRTLQKKWATKFSTINDAILGYNVVATSVTSQNLRQSDNFDRVLIEFFKNLYNSNSKDLILEHSKRYSLTNDKQIGESRPMLVVTEHDKGEIIKHNWFQDKFRPVTTDRLALLVKQSIEYVRTNDHENQ